MLSSCNDFYIAVKPHRSNATYEIKRNKCSEHTFANKCFVIAFCLFAILRRWISLSLPPIDDYLYFCPHEKEL